MQKQERKKNCHGGFAMYFTKELESALHCSEVRPFLSHGKQNRQYAVRVIVCLFGKLPFWRGDWQRQLLTSVWQRWLTSRQTVTSISISGWVTSPQLYRESANLYVSVVTYFHACSSSSLQTPPPSLRPLSRALLHMHAHTCACARTWRRCMHAHTRKSNLAGALAHMSLQFSKHL